jgi:hypothetical protein
MGRSGSIYSSHLKKSYWGIFHRTSPVDLSRICWNLSGSRLGIRQVSWHHRKSWWRPLESDWSLWNPVSDRTCPVVAPNLPRSPVKSLWNPVDSPDMHGIRRFGVINTLTFPQTFLMHPTWEHDFPMTQIKYRIFDLWPFDHSKYLFPFWVNVETLPRENSLQNSIKG